MARHPVRNGPLQHVLEEKITQKKTQCNREAKIDVVESSAPPADDHLANLCTMREKKV